MENWQDSTDKPVSIHGAHIFVGETARIDSMHADNVAAKISQSQGQGLYRWNALALSWN